MQFSFNLRDNSISLSRPPFSSLISSRCFVFLEKNSFEFGKLFVVIFDAGIHGTIEFVDSTITLLEQKDESEAELSYRLDIKSKHFSLANLNERKGGPRFRVSPRKSTPSRVL